MSEQGYPPYIFEGDFSWSTGWNPEQAPTGSAAIDLQEDVCPGGSFASTTVQSGNVCFVSHQDVTVF